MVHAVLGTSLVAEGGVLPLLQKKICAQDGHLLHHLWRVGV
jgi:hypothetical protein